MKKNIFVILIMIGFVFLSRPPLQAAAAHERHGYGGDVPGAGNQSDTSGTVPPSYQEMQEQKRPQLSIDRPTANEARQAANDLLIKMKSAKAWGRAELGEGFEIFEISDAKFLIEEQIQDFASLYQPLGIWAFPVKTDSHDQPEFILRVRRINNKWTINSEYGIKDVKNMISFADTWPKAKGFDYKIISASMLDLRLIELSLGGKILGVAVSYSDEATEFDPSVLHEPKEAAREVQDLVKRFNESRRSR